MESKFIDGTNEQFSIREDGVVIQHYTYTWKNNKTYSAKDKHLKVFPNNQVFIISKKKRTSVTINNLLRKYFNKYICVSCKNLYECKDIEYKCDLCKKEKIRVYNKISKEKHKNLVTKSLIANHLRCFVSDLTDEICVSHKKKILLKRQIAKDYNINIKKIVES